MKKLLLFTMLSLMSLVGFANPTFIIKNNTPTPLVLSNVNNAHGHLKYRYQGKLDSNRVIIIPAGGSKKFVAKHPIGGHH